MNRKTEELLDELQSLYDTDGLYVEDEDGNREPVILLGDALAMVEHVMGKTQPVLAPPVTEPEQKAPWRAVVENRRARNVHPATAYQKLECGHLMTFTGEKALDAKYVKKRRCKECLKLQAE